MAVVHKVFARLTVFVGELRDLQEGQGMTEYAVLLGVVVVVGAGALIAFRGKLEAALNGISIP